MQLRSYQEVQRNSPDDESRHILTTNYISCSTKLIVQILGASSGPSDIVQPRLLRAKVILKGCFFGGEQYKSIN